MGCASSVAVSKQSDVLTDLVNKSIQTLRKELAESQKVVNARIAKLEEPPSPELANRVEKIEKMLEEEEDDESEELEIIVEDDDEEEEEEEEEEPPPDRRLHFLNFSW
uniref:Uncharacterized protein n=1 Tax=viral metagenome TaxID=1070528 RepID=A0A6C0I5H5_9ZZZZ